jgi:hypothetical protein
MMSIHLIIPAQFLPPLKDIPAPAEPIAPNNVVPESVYTPPPTPAPTSATPIGAADSSDGASVYTPPPPEPMPVVAAGDSPYTKPPTSTGRRLLRGV